jgi:hypothetical protein
LYADAAINLPALTSEAGNYLAAFNPLGLSLVEIPGKGLVQRDAPFPRPSWGLGRLRHSATVMGYG